jgi:hypothetical protein
MVITCHIILVQLSDLSEEKELGSNSFMPGVAVA